MSRIHPARAASLFAILPLLFWSAGPDTAPALRTAGVDHFSAPENRISPWKEAGFQVTPLDEDALHRRIQLTPPGIDRKVQVASATTAPWVNANGWRIRRQPDGEFWYDAPAGTAALAAAEAFTYRANAVLKIDPGDLAPLGAMLRFLQSLPDKDLPDIADFGFIDNGSDLAAEQLNLLSRRNLLYRIVRAPDSHLRLNVAANDDDPHLFAAKVREHLSDEQRSLRVYGSEVVLCRLTGDAAQARVHVLNYGRRPLDGVRLRVRGNYARAKVYTTGTDAQVHDYAAADGFTEFSLPQFAEYAVIDLQR